MDLMWAWANQQVVATYKIYFHFLVKFVEKKCAPMILVFHTTVILNEGQGHSNWYKNVEFSGVYHHIKLANVQTHADMFLGGEGGEGEGDRSIKSLCRVSPLNIDSTR